MPEAVIVLKPRQTTAKHWKRSQLELNRKHAGERRLNQLWAFMQEKTQKHLDLKYSVLQQDNTLKQNTKTITFKLYNIFEWTRANMDYILIKR